jgi:hypothetical protein
MSAIAGPYGSRKSLVLSFPRLTGKSIPLIGNQLLSYNRDMPKNDEGVFLTGLLFCNLWKDNNESIIGQIWYDPTFAGARDDPIECVKMYLRKYNIDESGMRQIIESTLKQGYISYDPVPYVGKIYIRGINGEKINLLSEQEKIIYIILQNIIPGPGAVSEDAKIGQILFAVEGGASWDGLILGLAGSRSWNLRKADQDMNEFLRVNDATSNDLDATVKNMILKEKITSNNEVIGTIELSWD